MLPSSVYVYNKNPVGKSLLIKETNEKYKFTRDREQCNFAMKSLWMIVIRWLFLGKVSESKDVVDLSFPEDFSIGAATASYQVEGAWNVSGKGESIWDRWTHESPQFMDDGSNGDIACDSYYQYKEDVQRIKSIGLDFYRFSISWTRILPTGIPNVINYEGLQYYKNLTAELVANGIDPVVTIYHFDHPQFMEDIGGWTNELVIEWFVWYAKILFQELGDNVKTWITINEPENFCNFDYEGTEIRLAPGKQLFGMGKYVCGHNALKAHAKVYHMYDKEFRPTQKGQVGIIHACTAYISSNPDDTLSADTAFQFSCGWLGHPIYVGDYPKIMKERIAMISKIQGYPVSRLPEFSDYWINYIKGTYDYFGLNHYSSSLVTPDPDEEKGIFTIDSGLKTSPDPSWPTSNIWWQRVYAPGFGHLLRKIKDEFNNPPVRIMENGYADAGELDDYDRINYHYEYVKELLIAVKRDGCNVKSYSIWSLLDNFEWNSGYTQKFGIIGVDFNHPNRTRSDKLSTYWWKSVLKTRKLQPVPVKKLQR